VTKLLTATEQLCLVAFANLAPSVHNTQPARWHFGERGDIWILSDPKRHLAVGDPTGRDAGLSCGAALEATLLGLSIFGIEAASVDTLWGGGAASPIAGTVPAARLTTREGTGAMTLVDQVRQRFTWRRPFVPASGESSRALAAWALERSDLKLANDAGEIASLADFNDRASLAFMRKLDYRGELMSWMRLRRADPRWGVDGLNATALGMSSIEALGAGLVLRRPLFEGLDRLGLAARIVAEQAKTKTATAIGLFHRPSEESPVATGRAYFRLLLNLTRLGFQTWPMTAMADDPEISAELCRRHAIPDADRLVTVLRIGVVPTGAAPGRARLAPADLIWSKQL
jgi:hypothetical protein